MKVEDIERRLFSKGNDFACFTLALDKPIRYVLRKSSVISVVKMEMEQKFMLIL